MASKRRFDPVDLGCRCDVCPLGKWHRDRGTFAPVAPEGPNDAQLVFIGEEPGPEEERQGRPMIGQSGNLLMRTLNRLQILRQDVFLDNALLCRPPNNDLQRFNVEIVATENEKIKELNKTLPRADRVPKIPTPQESCRPHVRLLVDEAAQRGAMVVVLGKLAYWAITGRHARINAVRGSFGEYVRVPEGPRAGSLVEPSAELDALWGTPARIRMVATVNPAFAMREANYREVLHRDIERGLRWKHNELQWEPPVLRSLYPSAHLLTDWLRAGRWYSWDLETTYEGELQNKLRTIGIYSIEQREGIVIPWVSIDGKKGFAPGETGRPAHEFGGGTLTLSHPAAADYYESLRPGGTSEYGGDIPWWHDFDEWHYDRGDGLQIREVLTRWFQDPGIVKIGHYSGYFDQRVMQRHLGMGFPQNHIDQILLTRVWNSEFPRSLYFVGTMMTDVPAWKAAEEDRKISRNPRSYEELAQYNLVDVKVTAITGVNLIKRAQDTNKWPVAELDHRIEAICDEMRATGLYVDEPTRAEFEEEYREKQKKELDTIARVAGPAFNPASTKQLGKLLYDDWKLPIPLLTGTGKPSTSEDAIRILLTTPGLLDGERREMIEALWRGRGWSKALSTVILPLRRRSQGGVVYDDGVMRSDYAAHIPATGRMSSGGNGLNCFDGQTEILTARGWFRFDELPRGVPCAQYHADTGEIDYALPTRYHEADHTGHMVHVRSHQTDLFVTPNHRCLLESPEKRPYVFEARDYPSAGFSQLHAGVTGEGRVRSVWSSAVEQSWSISTPWEGRVYCVSMPSSFIIVRRRGKVMITGQTQNIEALLRRMIRPRPGHLFLISDFDQIELRLVSAIAGVGAYLDAFARPKSDPMSDPHAVTALLIYGKMFQDAWDEYKVTHNKVSLYTALRRFAKTFVYAVLYGGTAGTVYDSVSKATDDEGNLLFPNMTREEVETNVRRWMRNAYEIPAWWESVWKFVADNGYVEEPILGRRRHMPAFLRNEALNMPIQGAAGIIMSQGLIRLREIFSPNIDLGLGIVNQMHDAVTLEVPEKEAERAADIVTETLTCSYPQIPRMRFTSAAKVALDFAETDWLAEKEFEKALQDAQKNLRKRVGGERYLTDLTGLEGRWSDGLDPQYDLARVIREINSLPKVK